MKFLVKKLIHMLSLTAIWALMVISTKASDSTVDSEWKYKVKNNQITITQYKGNSEDVIIPSKIGGYKVTKINKEAFYECSEIKKIVIPDGVVSIGEAAFWGCSSLTSITIPDTVKNIDVYAFTGCVSLEYFTFPAGLTVIKEGVLAGCTGIKCLIIPKKVTAIEEYAFVGCANLRTVTMYIKVKEIAATAFEECYQKLRIRGYKDSYAISYARKYNKKYSYIKDAVPKAPTELNLTTVAGGVKLSWTKSDNSIGYYVYRGNSLIAVINSSTVNTYTDKLTYKYGASLKYKVIPFSYSGTGGSRSRSVYYLNAPVIKSIVNSGTGKVSIEWCINKKCSGYQIMYRTGNTEKIIRVRDAATLTKVIKNLPQDSTCRFYVRAYRTGRNSTYYSSWSKVSRIKIRN